MIKSTFTPEFKNQIINEVKKTGNIRSVANKHSLKYHTVRSWTASIRSKPTIQTETDLGKLKLENFHLRELLTHHISLQNQLRDLLCRSWSILEALKLYGKAYNRDH